MRAFPDETLLIPVASGAANLDAIYVLNETAVRVWALLDGRTTEEQIASVIADEYDAPLTEVRNDVASLLNDLAEGGLAAEVTGAGA